MTKVIIEVMKRPYIPWAMKNQVTILLLTLLVSIQTPIGQFLKLPVLLEHFSLHQKQNRLSFFAFLVDHYGSDHNDDDFPEDQKLPFKNIRFNSIDYVMVMGGFKTEKLVSVSISRIIILAENYRAEQALFSIFHPPKKLR